MPGLVASGEKTRREVNQWIRDGGEFDAVIDFEAALRDPASPQRLLPRYDSGDTLHPNDSGYAAMAEAAFEVLTEIVQQRALDQRGGGSLSGVVPVTAPDDEIASARSVSTTTRGKAGRATVAAAAPAAARRNASSSDARSREKARIAAQVGAARLRRNTRRWVAAVNPVLLGSGGEIGRPEIPGRSDLWQITPAPGRIVDTCSAG